MYPRWKYCAIMIKYILVVSVLIALLGVLYNYFKQQDLGIGSTNSRDQRNIEDHGGKMPEMKYSRIGDSILTLPDDLTEGKRILVIGDVHGCLSELTSLLQKSGVLKTDDLKDGLNEDSLVVFVGDLVNKGPNSRGVLDFAMETKGVYSVRGNHECYWILQDRDREVSKEHMDYLISLPYVISIPRHNAIIVHAGLYGDRPIPEQKVWDIVHMRNLVPQEDGSFIADSEDKVGVHWATEWKGPEHVYFGHDARRGRDERGHPRVQRFPLVTGLDTRCVKGGALTGVVLPVENEEFYSVMSLKSYWTGW